MNEEEIINAFLGTCRTVASVIEQFELDYTDEDITEICLNHNIECCNGCGWWMNSFDLVPDDDKDEDGIGYCEDCRNE